MQNSFVESAENRTDYEYQSMKDLHCGRCIVTFIADGNKCWGAVDNMGTLIFSIPDESWSENGIFCLYDFYEYDCAKGRCGGSECLISRDGKILLRSITEGDMEFRDVRGDSFDFNYGNGTLCIRGLLDEDGFARTGSERLSTFYGAFDRSGEWVVEPKYKSYAEVMAVIECSSMKRSGFIPSKVGKGRCHRDVRPD